MISIICALTLINYSSVSDFPPKSCDFLGYTLWSDVATLSKREQVSYELLIASRFEDSDREFSKLVSINANNPLNILGVSQSRRGKNEVRRALVDDSQKIESFLQKKAPIPDSLLLSYGINFAFDYRQIVNKMSNAGKPIAINYGKPEYKWRHTALSMLSQVKSKDRAYTLIQASIFMAINDRTRARMVASSGLIRDKNFYQLRLLYAAMLNSGSVQRVRGGKSVPVPSDEKPSPERALSEAVKVTSQAPRWAIGWYVAGQLQWESDALRGRKYLEKYLSMKPSDEERVRRAKELLSRP